MKKTFIATALVAAFAAAGTVWYAEGAAQHRKPNEPATGQQPAQPRQPPQAKPRDGQKPAPDSPSNQAVPRPPDARRDPDRPRRGPERGPVVVPYPGWPWWGYPYPYGYPPTPWRVYADWETTSVRLDVSPTDAQVYVDSYYAGVVDDFDGIFQRLTLRPGPHLIEIRKTGYRALAVEMNLYPGQSVTYRRTMEPASETDNVAAAPGFEEGARPTVTRRHQRAARRRALRRHADRMPPSTRTASTWASSTTSTDRSICCLRRAVITCRSDSTGTNPSTWISRSMWAGR